MATRLPRVLSALVGGAALAVAVGAFALVPGLSWRRGVDSDRVVLMGIGVTAAMAALTTLVIVLTDPWNTR